MSTFQAIFSQTYNQVTADFGSIEAFLKKVEPRKLLDLGAGFGRTLSLYKGIESVVLADKSEEMCQQLRENASQNGMNCEVVRTFSYRLPFEDNSFDAVVLAFAALSEMEPLLFTLAEVARVLRPGGSVYTLTTNPEAYRTSSKGLDRAVQNKWPISASAETIQTFGKGRFQFEVQILSRMPGQIEKIILEQTCPDLNDFKELFSRLGLHITALQGGFNNEDFTEGSPLIVLHAEKSQDAVSQSIATENGRICEKLYDSMAPKYDSISGAPTYNVPGWIKKNLGSYKGFFPSVLDCACASGNLAGTLSEIDLEPSVFFGIDVSSEMVKLARSKRAYSSVAKLDLSHGVPVFRENLFDVIISNGCLEFLEDPPIFLESLFRAAIPGGILLSTFEASHTEQDEVTEMALAGGTLRRSARTRSTVENLLRKAGWTLEEVEQHPGYVSPSTGATVSYWFCRARKVL